MKKLQRDSVNEDPGVMMTMFRAVKKNKKQKQMIFLIYNRKKRKNQAAISHFTKPAFKIRVV